MNSQQNTQNNSKQNPQDQRNNHFLNKELNLDFTMDEREVTKLENFSLQESQIQYKQDQTQNNQYGSLIDGTHRKYQTAFQSINNKDNSNLQDPTILEQIEQNEISFKQNEQQEQSFQKKSFYSPEQKIQANSYLNQKVIIKSLQEIFQFYNKNNLKIQKNSTFENVQQKINTMNLQNFNSFCKKFQIANFSDYFRDPKNKAKPNNQKLVQLFQNASNCMKQINFEQFCILMDQIAKLGQNVNKEMDKNLIIDKNQQNFNSIINFYIYIGIDSEKSYKKKLISQQTPFINVRSDQFQIQDKKDEINQVKSNLYKINNYERIKKIQQQKLEKLEESLIQHKTSILQDKSKSNQQNIYVKNFITQEPVQNQKTNQVNWKMLCQKSPNEFNKLLQGEVFNPKDLIQGSVNDEDLNLISKTNTNKSKYFQESSQSNTSVSEKLQYRIQNIQEIQQQKQNQINQYTTQQIDKRIQKGLKIAQK